MSKSVQMPTSSPSKHENAKHNLGFEANNRGVWLHAKNEAVATVRYAIASKKCRKQNQQNLFEETILKTTTPFFCTKSQSYIDSWTQNDSKKNEKSHSYIGNLENNENIPERYSLLFTCTQLSNRQSSTPVLGI